jgi:hypothetical protein
MRAFIWFVMAVAWGIDAGVSWHLHRNGHAALTAGIALAFALIGWIVRSRDRRFLSNKRN